ncbi:MAG: hypothetical protein LC650_02245 [Actinobacteria bacterium]|nr:hypothetical protein [Actinomycetota bacterium]
MLVTTKQVRDVMRTHGHDSGSVYTNKVKSADGTVRSVKCYYCDNDRLVADLRKLAGAENVKITQGGEIREVPGTRDPFILPGITVRCQIA